MSDTVSMPWPSRVRSRIGRVLLPHLMHVNQRPDLARIGSDYGGWIVPKALLKGSSICYSGGVGEDVSFDLALIQEFSCDVFAFDPTPRAIRYAKEVSSREAKFRFYPWGLWSRDEEMRFYAPRNPEHVSHSIVNLQGTEEFFVARCRRLRSVMDQLGHSTIDLLKIDIEGAEHEVLRDMLESGIRPHVVCVEFDQPAPIARTWRSLKRLRLARYRVVAVEGWNFTFVRS